MCLQEWKSLYNNNMKNLDMQGQSAILNAEILELSSLIYVSTLYPPI